MAKKSTSKDLISGKNVNKADTKDAPKAVADAPEQSEADALRAELAEVKKDLANAQAKKDRAPGELTIKASAKGCVCVYGLMRFPVSLYKSQWQRLAKEMGRVDAFIKENDAILPDKKAAPVKEAKK